MEPPAEDLPRDPRWLPALAGGVLVSCVVVPCLFTTRLAAVFVVPKLAASLVMLPALTLIGDVSDPRFGNVHSYHESVLVEVVQSQRKAA